ncbi:ribokinase-like protein [Malassezia pachydermatis]|uniref:ATP-dependent (S)-NAD(P)H-hydrate dehydratase n=1 Tax=Malassezia pachydermatis TaxID=77020 RepID=A0A0M8MV72_9BASI|nr:ribokinase-like protein [Malassezia pachydermatis]KOS14420.1 ribokinase-like protein [Malassezia pachydermatis]
MPTPRSMRSQVQAIISPLLPEFHKGQAGRVGILGGCKEYTGAPYYASMSSMRLGCDMSFTICAPEAAPPLKTYSPDLIVHPILDHTKSTEDVRNELRALFKRLHSVVIGPGLGRDTSMQSFARVALEVARESNLYAVVDADGLWLVQNDPESVKGYKRAILTPNVVEFQRLCDAMGVEASDDAAQRLSIALGGLTIVEKGQVDRIVTPTDIVICDEEGGLKRCGGQGDLLSGTLGTFLAWAQRFEERTEAGEDLPSIPAERLPLLAALGASTVTRVASRRGFARLRRSMLANDLLDEIGPAYESTFGST